MLICDKCGINNGKTKNIVGEVIFEIKGYHCPYTGKRYRWNLDLCKKCTSILQDKLDELLGNGIIKT